MIWSWSGAETIGGWAATFAAEAGHESTLSCSSAGWSTQEPSGAARAGIVRAPGAPGRRLTLGRWTIQFYRGQEARYGTDSGFRELGYMILAVTARDQLREAARGIGMQRRAGLDVKWVSAGEGACAVNPTLAETGHRGRQPR